MMLSIGQFSKICQVSVKALHHYNKIDLMNPACIDEFTGYRYYDKSQIGQLLLIQRLKRYGFSLSQIKEFLSCENQKTMHKQLIRQKHLLAEQMEQMDLIVQEIEAHLTDYERTGDIMGYQNKYEIKMKNTEDLVILSSRQHMSVDDFGKYYGMLYEKVAKEELTLTGMVLALYHDEEFNHECSDIEVAVAIAEKEKATRVLPGALCASTIHKGGYSSLSDAYGAIVQWIDDSEYEVVDCPYEIYRKNQFDGLAVEEWETEIFFPVKKK